ncbi:YxiG-like protein [Promicromonospora soli]|uniref:YxiG-like domain-containing protein n=1 Tax=Promicromonospora soli TaxID=2035533 RepID=A0A919FZW3_9MICO|nr:hypothetical protein [Promicromonospora soli]GHH74881.1 hypothetical protein GCM10017772_29860 [Promicromonospora soli]
MDEQQIRQAFDEVLDQALVFHGFTDYMRDYDLYIYATADPRTGIEPEHIRYRFTHCVRATVTTTVRRDVWLYSQDDDLIDYDAWIESGEREAYVWGVKWQALYPGMQLIPASPEAQEWSIDMGRPFHEALIETNGHNLSLIFSGLEITKIAPGASPFVVPTSGPDAKFHFE